MTALPYSRYRAGLGTWDLLFLLGLAVCLVAVGYIMLRPTRGSDARSLTVSRLQEVAKALEDYAIDNAGSFPTTRQGLKALLEAPTGKNAPRNWRGPYLKDPGLIRDGWGREFHYIAPGGGDPPRAFDLWSPGADNREGGEGAAADVNSWDRTTLLSPR